MSDKDKSTEQLIEEIQVLRGEIFTPKKKVNASDEKRTEAEDNLQSFLDACPEAAFFIDSDFVVIASNEEMARGFGMTADELIGSNLMSVLPPPVAARRKVHLEQILETKESFYIEDNLGPRTIAVSMHPVLDSARNVVRIAIWGIDVSKRVAAENQLRASEEKFNKAFMAGPDIISISRLSDGKFYEVNENFLRATGYTRTEVLGKSVFELGIWSHVEDREQLIDWLRASEPVDSYEIQMTMKNGRQLWCSLSARLIHVDDQECIIAITRDITEKKRMESEREHLIEELQEALSQVQTLGGLLPICASCKKIRDDKGYWNQVERFFQERSGAKFSHGICPDCAKQWYPKFCKEDS